MACVKGRIYYRDANAAGIIGWHVIDIAPSTRRWREIARVVQCLTSTNIVSRIVKACKAGTSTTSTSTTSTTSTTAAGGEGQAADGQQGRDCHA